MQSYWEFICSQRLFDRDLTKKMFFHVLYITWSVKYNSNEKTSKYSLVIFLFSKIKFMQSFPQKNSEFYIENTLFWFVSADTLKKLLPCWKSNHSILSKSNISCRKPFELAGKNALCGYCRNWTSKNFWNKQFLKIQSSM